ncbi:cytochrome d ubiquinol oxidase subunit I [Allocatelliglobosispora scoriae]|uniref:Cytochrome d ubiquinol oxidase subunit I n=1 Tax=Allocatelliglobosispora scoriae TaxID=643052 RepID=A0A841BH65_9ACTN|nr:cytochrome ubiquinol oxidase subunit I [Allocatelliglobosispora scoriae]MBB5866975.1 cytochrome d ubiquinol oxidase subunit I [Allocatelliglobosispora scoriae]
MDALDWARWQFGITTVYHFLFVPLTIGLSFLVAGMQTAWVRTRDDRWLRLTKLFGKLFLINIAMGVVTGIVQEFQFGMNWSAYSRFVGDIFGAPLAIEALLAFFLESTFIGLWIFGWEKLPRKAHLACIWLVAIGTALSAYFILAANSFMQNPVGFRFNPETKRAELTDFGAVLTNKVALITFPHTLAGAFLAAGALVAAVGLWHLIRRPGVDVRDYRSAVKVGAWTTLIATAAILLTGDIQGKIMTEVQPMKMAAAEALYETAQPAPFSILTIGTLDGTEPVWQIEIPGLLSFLATGDFNGKVEGINDLQAQYEAKYGPGNYKPIIPVTYWTFRAMIGFGLLAAAIALLALWTLRRGRVPTSTWLLRAALLLPLTPLAANAFGWIFTEMGRQPWIVFSQMRTADGVSPTVGAGSVITSLSVYTALYGILAVVEVGLLLKYAKAGLPDVVAPPEKPPLDDEDRPLAFAY